MAKPNQTALHQVFGTCVRRIRCMRKLSRISLATMLGIPVISLRYWEGGYHIPRWDRLIKLADALSVPVSMLFMPKPSLDTKETGSASQIVFMYLCASPEEKGLIHDIIRVKVADLAKRD
jgi:transcriptional regulator with XRE-family HTH domain